METRNFESIITENAITKALQYSDNPEKLRALLSQVKIEVKYNGIMKYFPEDKEERQVIAVRIIRNTQEIEFPFGMSIRDTEILSKDPGFYGKKMAYQGVKYIANEKRKVKEDMLYGILCSVGLDGSIPDTFNDLCAELGYDEDSRKAEKIFHNSIEQKRKIRKIFSEIELSYMPQ